MEAVARRVDQAEHHGGQDGIALDDGEQRGGIGIAISGDAEQLIGMGRHDRQMRNAMDQFTSAFDRQPETLPEASPVPAIPWRSR